MSAARGVYGPLLFGLPARTVVDVGLTGKVQQQEREPVMAPRAFRDDGRRSCARRAAAAVVRRVARWWRLGGSVLATLLLAGCRSDRSQSMLHPAGPAAEAISRLWWILFVVCGVYFVIVLVLTLIAVLRRPTGRAPRYGGHAFIVIGGVAIPAVILVTLLFFSLNTTAALRRPEAGLTIRVVGHQWWWEVHYPEQNIATANELYVPAGEPVRLELTSADVVHSFWVPRLHGKIDLLPGKTTYFWLEAREPGTFRGQCAEYCGLQHAHMAFFVTALPAQEFAAWVRERQAPHSAPDSDVLLRGQQTFFRAGCSACHAIRGTEATSRIGPDLTHIGSRQTLGAGTIPNSFGNLAGWIANPQAIKPGARMPATFVGSEDFQALVEYLSSLQ